MIEIVGFYNSVVLLWNVIVFVGLIYRVNFCVLGLSGMVIFYGYLGYGKIIVVVYVVNKFNVIQVQVKESWMGKKFCQFILGEMVIVFVKIIVDMVDQIVQELMFLEKVLIVDDVQYLIKCGIIGILCDIYESSGNMIILIGEESLLQDL